MSSSRPSPAASVPGPPTVAPHAGEPLSSEALPGYLTALRGVFATLRPLPVSLTARLFWRLFTRPIRSTLKPPHEALGGQARSRTLATRIAGRPGKLPLLTWGPEGGKRVLLLHGWSGKGLDYYRMIPALIEAGYQVEAIDFAGHGQAPGYRTHALEMAAQLMDYLSTEPQPYAVIAHSLGGASLAWAMVQKRQTIDRLVLMTPPVHLHHAFDVGFDTMGVRGSGRRWAIVRWVEGHLRGQFPRLAPPNLEAMSLPALATSLAALTNKLALIWVDGDTEVPVAHRAEAGQLFPEARQAVIYGTDHNRVLRHPDAITTILEVLA